MQARHVAQGGGRLEGCDSIVSKWSHKEQVKQRAEALLLLLKECMSLHQPWLSVLQARHNAQGHGSFEGVLELEVVSSWVSKELLKTSAGAQLLCLNLELNSHQSWSSVLQGRHDAQGGGSLEGVPELGIVSKWRQKERLKTTAVALVLCLNIGVDPPDVIKISPCARLECWVDPLSMQPPKALETIGTRPVTHTCIRCKPFHLHP